MDNVNRLFAGIWQQMMADRVKRVVEECKTDPERHRNTMVMGERGNAYRYYESKTARLGEIIRWCWTSHKNAAGFYLAFIEIHKGKAGVRTFARGFERRRDAKADALARWRDARKPKAERRYTIPDFTSARRDAGL